MKLKLEKIEELIASLKSYSNTTIELIQLETVENSSIIIANLISKFIVGLVIVLFVFFLSLGICFYLSELLGNNYIGFGIVAGSFLLLGIILSIGRKKLLNKPIRDKIIQEMFHTKL
jgi:hypothetical protein